MRRRQGTRRGIQEQNSKKEVWKAWRKWGTLHGDGDASCGDANTQKNLTDDNDRDKDKLKLRLQHKEQKSFLPSRFGKVRFSWEYYMGRVSRDGLMRQNTLNMHPKFLPA